MIENAVRGPSQQAQASGRCTRFLPMTRAALGTNYSYANSISTTHHHILQFPHIAQSPTTGSSLAYIFVFRFQPSVSCCLCRTDSTSDRCEPSITRRQLTLRLWFMRLYTFFRPSVAVPCLGDIVYCSTKHQHQDELEHQHPGSWVLQVANKNQTAAGLLTAQSSPLSYYWQEE